MRRLLGVLVLCTVLGCSTSVDVSIDLANKHAVSKLLYGIFFEEVCNLLYYFPVKSWTNDWYYVLILLLSSSVLYCHRICCAATYVLLRFSLFLLQSQWLHSSVLLTELWMSSTVMWWLCCIWGHVLWFPSNDCLVGTGNEGCAERPTLASVNVFGRLFADTVCGKNFAENFCECKEWGWFYLSFSSLFLSLSFLSPFSKERTWWLPPVLFTGVSSIWLMWLHCLNMI